MLRRVLPVTGTLVLSACAALLPPPPSPRPDPPTLQAQWLAADPADVATRAALARRGVDVSIWPLPAWDLPALTALALARDPDLAAAQAEARRAQAASAAAGVAAGVDPPMLDADLERRSGAAGASPWSVGLALTAALGGGARRQALADEAAAAADAAQQQVTEAAWQTRRRVRDAHTAWQHAGQGLALARERQRSAAEQRAAWQVRRDLGAADAPAVQAAQRGEADAAQALADAEAAVQRARTGLAASLFLPVERMAGLVLRDPVAQAAAPLDGLSLQRLALQGRSDLRLALARYDAAEAALRGELARRWPTFTLRPGLGWDQGVALWSLGLGLTLPPPQANAAGIAQAQARREAEAARVLAVQVAALDALQAARDARQAAEAAQTTAQTGLDAALLAEARARRLLASGDADRLTLLAARDERLAAQARLLDRRRAGDAARDALEDAVQRPLDGSAWPLPGPAAYRLATR